MKIERFIDIEDEIRQALAPYMTALVADSAQPTML